jgi:two-component system, NarL family, response regulator DevR
MVSDGMRNKEIGAKMGITEASVKNYMRPIFDKLGVWNRVELAIFVTNHPERFA